MIFERTMDLLIYMSHFHTSSLLVFFTKKNLPEVNGSFFRFRDIKRALLLCSGAHRGNHLILSAKNIWILMSHECGQKCVLTNLVTYPWPLPPPPPPPPPLRPPPPLLRARATVRA